MFLPLDKEFLMHQYSTLCAKCDIDKDGLEHCVCAENLWDEYISKYSEKASLKRLRELVRSKYNYTNNKESVLTRMQWTRIRKKYGITKQEYEEMLGAQGGRCAICRSENPGTGKIRFSVDHCHDTGKVRGLLCQTCNGGIGFLKNNTHTMKMAIQYLRRVSDGTEATKEYYDGLQFMF